MLTAPEPDGRDAAAATWIRGAAWGLGLAGAVFQAYHYRNWVNADSLAYLDMSDGLTGVGLDRLVNATWSPLFPALIGLLSALFRPTLHQEFAVAHLANLVSFVIAFAGFDFFLGATGSGDRTRRLPRWALALLAYSLFLWSALGMVTLMKLTPDMLMSRLLFFSLGLLTRIRDGAQEPWRHAALGATLGLGYLSKAIMFPLGVIMLGIAALSGPNRFPRRAALTLLSLGAFLAVSLPYAAAVSRQVGHPTFGQAGTVVHLTYVDKAASYWQSTGTAGGVFRNPPRMIQRDPPVFEFRRPLAVTSTFWFDPAYWVTGAVLRFDLGQSIRTLAGNVRLYLWVVRGLPGVVLALGVLAVLAGWHGTARSVVALWPLGFVAVAALGAYGLVHVEERYIGAFLTIIVMGLLGRLDLPAEGNRAVVGSLAIIAAVNLGFSSGAHMVRDANEQSWKASVGDAEAAEALHGLGVGPGSVVGVVNPWVADGWARLARVSIVAEMDRSRASTLDTASAEVQARTLEAFRRSGVAAVVWHHRNGTAPVGWTRLGNSRYFAVVFR